MKREKFFCDCAPPLFAPELRQTGLLDPGNPGYYCNICKKRWHHWGLTDEYRKKIKNMARTYRYSQKPTFEEKWQTEEEFKRILEIHEIKKINISAKGEYSCVF